MAATIKTFRNIFHNPALPGPSSSISAMLTQLLALQYTPPISNKLGWKEFSEADIITITSYLLPILHYRYKEDLDTGHPQNDS